MDARLARGLVVALAWFSLGAGYRTQNFIVSAPTPELSKQIGDAAERFRHDLAIEWLGEPLRAWAQPCPIAAQVAPTLGAGGATSFLFEHGEVHGWQMTIQGSRERILDSVLPHEVTHTIFATHFRRALPRWADEGACTTVEHSSERNKQQVMLVDFLRTGRGIAFNRLFAMKDYPRDVLPLYSQGFSLARYLIDQGGRRKFVRYLGEGLQSGNWTRATHDHYGYADLGELQNAWLAWVQQGSPALQARPRGKDLDEPPQVAAGDRRGRPAPNLIYRTASTQSYSAGDEEPAGGSAYAPGGRLVPVGPPAGPDELADADRPGPRADDVVRPRNGSAGWQAARGRARDDRPAQVAARDVGPAPDDERPLAQMVSRPQPMQPARQIILEWSKE